MMHEWGLLIDFREQILSQELQAFGFIHSWSIIDCCELVEVDIATVYRAQFYE